MSYDMDSSRRLEAIADGAPSPEEVLSARQCSVARRAALASALATLGAEQREVIARRHLREVPETVAAIAALLGRTPSQVAATERKALEAMRSVADRSQGALPAAA